MISEDLLECVLSTMFFLTGDISKLLHVSFKDSMIISTISIMLKNNFLIFRMTVIEHFWFYGRLRGRTTKKVLAEAEEMVKALGLSEKRNAISSSLSGGMKRKLSVATAFVGMSLIYLLLSFTQYNLSVVDIFGISVK